MLVRRNNEPPVVVSDEDKLMELLAKDGMEKATFFQDTRFPGVFFAMTKKKVVRYQIENDDERSSNEQQEV